MQERMESRREGAAWTVLKGGVKDPRPKPPKPVARINCRRSNVGTFGIVLSQLSDSRSRPSSTIALFNSQRRKEKSAVLYQRCPEFTLGHYTVQPLLHRTDIQDFHCACQPG